ncbi:NXPE family member 3-like [Styela clava]
MKLYIKYLIILTILQVIGVLYHVTKSRGVHSRWRKHGSTFEQWQPEHSDIKQKIQSSKWIKYFPRVCDMVSKLQTIKTFPLLEDTTCANLTTVTLFNDKTDYQIGDTLKAIIQARNFNNGTKWYGGDFFRATLYRTFEPLAGVACDIVDKLNGSYVISCPLPWIGKARLSVKLIHPSESLLTLMLNSSGSRELGVSLKATVNNTFTNKQELVECGFDFGDKLSSNQICNHSNPRNGEPWFCVKTTSHECPPIEWMDRYYDKDEDNQIQGNKPLFKTGINLRTRVRGPNKWVYITTKAQNNVGKPIPKITKFHDLFKRNVAQTAPFSKEPMSATGWFDDDQWRSFLCNNTLFNVKNLEDCLRNHTVYFIGDSTVRHWYNFTITELNGTDYATDGPSIWAQARNGVVNRSNITLHYRAHGPPLHNPGTLKVRPYITDTMDDIPANSDKMIVLFSIGLHMDLFNPDIYLHRIRGIKLAIQRLQSRSPKVRVFVKGHHVHSQSTRICPSDWLSYRHDVLLRHIFGESHGVNYLPFWDMTSVFNNRPYHPNKKLLRIQLGLFQSFLCDN